MRGSFCTSHPGGGPFGIMFESFSDRFCINNDYVPTILILFFHDVVFYGFFKIQISIGQGSGITVSTGPSLDQLKLNFFEKALNTGMGIPFLSI